LSALTSKQRSLLEKILAVYHPVWSSRVKDLGTIPAAEFSRIAEYLERAVRALELFVPARQPGYGVTERGGDAVVAYFTGDQARPGKPYYLMIDVSGFTKLLTFLTDRFGKQEAGDIMNMSILNRYCLNRMGALISYYGSGEPDDPGSGGERALKSALSFRALLKEITLQVRGELTQKLSGKPHQDEIEAFISGLEIKASAGVVAAARSGLSGFYGREHRVRITWGRTARHLAGAEKVGGSDDKVTPGMAEVKGVGFDRHVSRHLESLLKKGWITPRDFRLKTFGAFEKLVLTARGESRLYEKVQDILSGFNEGPADSSALRSGAGSLTVKERFRRIRKTVSRVEAVLPYLQGIELVEQVVRGLGSGGKLQNLFGERASRVHETGILFANFSLADSKLLDELAEAMHEVMERYGLVYKYNIFPKGDFNLMAALGLDISGAPETDRVYAEVLWQCWRDLVGVVGRNFSGDVRLRGGMSVGQCLQGPVGDNLLHNELTIIGPDCNLAARLVARALTMREKDSTLIVASNSYGPLGHLVQPVGPFEHALLKGFREPVPLYSVKPRSEYESPAAFAQRLRRLPLVTVHGRLVDRLSRMRLDNKLSASLDYIESYAETSAGRRRPPSPILAFYGPGGAGKTRRLAEIMHWCREKGWTLIFAECLSWYQGAGGPTAEGENHGQTHAVPFYPVIRLLKEQVFQIPPHEYGEKALSRIVKKLAGLFGGTLLADQIKILASFLGIETFDQSISDSLSPEERRNVFFELVGDIFDRMTAGAEVKILFCIDDIQWADPASIRLLSFLRNRVKSGLLFCVTARKRKDLAALIPDEQEEPEAAASLILQLEPLKARGVRMLARLALGLAPETKLPLGLRKRLSELENNPLFIIEFCRKLLEQEVVFVRDSLLQRMDAQALERVTIPDRVQSVVEEMVNRLPRGEFDIIRHASVLGNILRCRDVAELNISIIGKKELDEQKVQQALHRLAGRQVLEIEQDRGMDSRYRFSRALIAQSLYQGLTPSLRKRLHGLSAAIWEKSAVENKLEKNLSCAMHYELAEKPDRAAGYYLDSGRMAGGLFENEKSVELLGKVERFCDLHRIQERDRLMLELHRIRSGVLLPLGKYRSALADCSKLEDLAGRLARNELLAQAVLQAGKVYLIRAKSGDYDKALAEFRRAEESSAGYRLLELESHNGQARVLLEMGNLLAAMETARSSLAELEKSSPKGKIDTHETILKARIYRNLGSSLMRLGKHKEALAEFETALGLLDDQGVSAFLPVKAQLLNSKALALSSSFKLEEALDVYYQAKSAARRVGDVNLQLMVLNNMSVSLNDSGKNAQALDLLLNSYDSISKLAGESRSLAAFEFNIGESYHFMEDLQQAEIHYRRSLGIAHKIGSIQFAVNIMYNLGEVLRDQGSTGEAGRILQEALDTARKNHYHQQEMDLENLLGEIDLAGGNIARAIERHQNAAALAGELDDRFGESWSKRNLAVALLETGDRARSAQACRMLVESLELARLVAQPENIMESLNMILKYRESLKLNTGDCRKFIQELEKLARNCNSRKYLDLCNCYRQSEG